MANYNQLSKEKRNSIEYFINNKKTFTFIGEAISVDRTTVAKEIKRNRICKSKLFLPFSKTGILRAEKQCDKLLKPPYVCNSCPFKNSCMKTHLYYNAKEAQKNYEKTLSESRQGYDISSNEVQIIEKNIIPLIKNKKQSVNQVYANHSDILTFSKVTFYKYVNEEVLSLNNLDLPKKVKYKKRKRKNNDNKRNIAILNGRTYEDFIKFCDKNRKPHIWQLDTVIGRVTDKKVLMTFLLVETNFMIIRLLNKKDIENVNNQFTNLKFDLGIELYKNIINAILTDNGIEFYDPIHMEFDLDTGEKISQVFYCHPNCPHEKAELEKNHEFIRRYLPKKTSFENLSSEQVKFMEDNINNIPRDIFGGKTPYQLTKEKYPDLIKALKSKYIDPDMVDLSIKSLKEVTSNKK